MFLANYTLAWWPRGHMTSLQQKLQDTQLSEDALRPGPAGQCVMQACGASGVFPGLGPGGTACSGRVFPSNLPPRKVCGTWLFLTPLIEVNSGSQGRLGTQVSLGHCKPQPIAPSSWEPQSHTGVWVQVGGATLVHSLCSDSARDGPQTQKKMRAFLCNLAPV